MHLSFTFFHIYVTGLCVGLKWKVIGIEGMIKSPQEDC